MLIRTVCVSSSYPLAHIEEAEYGQVTVINMIRHRRYASLDSATLHGLAPIRQAFTLQQSSSGPHTARLTAHTSPLALAPAISTPCSPHSDSDTEMEEQLERMVSSVVNSPTTPPSANFGSASQLGLGLPSTMQHYRRQVLSASAGRSLLATRGAGEGDPKLNMGMRAAVGSYRKRVLTGAHGSLGSQIIVADVEVVQSKLSSRLRHLWSRFLHQSPLLHQLRLTAVSRLAMPLQDRRPSVR